MNEGAHRMYRYNHWRNASTMVPAAKCRCGDDLHGEDKIEEHAEQYGISVPTVSVHS